MSTAVEDRKIKEIQLSQILPNPFNPRTSFPEQELRELSLSISETGVIQAVVLRQVGKKYQLVVGERRVRASRLAGMKTIPAEVKVLSDEEVMEIALIENLQRSEVPLMEEAVAFKNLSETGKYDVGALCAKFAKSEKYIRGRLALNNLLEGFKGLLSMEVINVGVAMELCKYSQEIQQEIFVEHFEQETGYSSWRGYTVKQIVKAIAGKYTTALKQYGFDKSDCANCPFNSSVFSLFGEDNGQGNCSNKSCLVTKNTQFMFESAKQLVDQDPKRLLCFDYSPNTTVNELLVEAGYSVISQNGIHSYPSLPEPPHPDPDGDAEAVAEEITEYKQMMADYEEKIDEIRVRVEKGEIIECVVVGHHNIALGYILCNATTMPNNPNAELERLKLKDKRNKEIAKEKIIADTKKAVHKAIYKDGFSDLEEQALYFLMLSALKREHFSIFGIKKEYYLNDDDKIKVCSKLTEEQKTLIRRDFLVQHLTSITTGSGLDFLDKFARQHVPEELKEIEKEHFTVYHKRHKSLSERINALKVKKQ